MEETFAPFLSDPRHAGIFCDFDGTLSEIVPLPDDARPVPGAGDLLSRLASRFRVVAVVSGRSASQLYEWLDHDLEIWGLHGAETVVQGEVRLSSSAARYRSLMTTVLEEAAQRVAGLPLAGLHVEDKRIMVTLHYRTADDVDEAERRLRDVASELATEHDLTIATGKMAFELRPPERFSKEDVIAARAEKEELKAVLFAGDDLVDLPAFDALDRLKASGVHTVRVAVDSAESPDLLIERADIVVNGPRGVLEILEHLNSEA